MATRLKLISMGILVAVSIFVAFAVGHAWQWLVCLALVFSWLGDALLARYAPLTRNIRDPFVAGMGAFAVAQIVYTIAFWLSIKGMPQLRMRVPGYYLGAEVLLALLPVYILLGLLCWVWVVMRSKKPGDLKGAALVYCLLLSTMAGFAASAAFTGASVAWPLIAGGALFMISDGLIALRLFAGRFPNERRYELAVWGTYLPAQILLLLGTSWLY